MPTLQNLKVQSLSAPKQAVYPQQSFSSQRPHAGPLEEPGGAGRAHEEEKERKENGDSPGQGANRQQQ